MANSGRVIGFSHKKAPRVRGHKVLVLIAIVTNSICRLSVRHSIRVRTSIAVFLAPGADGHF